MKAGVALNPHTPVSLLQDVIGEFDLVCLMSVNPGFGGQKFIERTYQKVRELRGMINEAGASAMIEIDGGVGSNNWAKLVDAERMSWLRDHRHSMHPSRPMRSAR